MNTSCVDGSIVFIDPISFIILSYYSVFLLSGYFVTYPILDSKVSVFFFLALLSAIYCFFFFSASIFFSYAVNFLIPTLIFSSSSSLNCTPLPVLAYCYCIFFISGNLNFIYAFLWTYALQADCTFVISLFSSLRSVVEVFFGID